MSGIVLEDSQWNVSGTDVWIKGGSIGMFVHSVPESKVGSASSCIVLDGIVRVGDPETSRGDVIVQQARTGSDKCGQIVLEEVASFNAIFQEKGTSHDIVDDIVFHPQVVGLMDVHCSVESLVETAAPDIGGLHVTIQMQVDGVSSKSVGLTHVRQLNILNTGNGQFQVRFGCMDQDVSSKFIRSHLISKTTLETGLGSKLSYNIGYV